MTHASLFTGIGGFDLAAQWMGWENLFQCEIDAWCRTQLEKNFPHAQRYTDIRQFDAAPWRGAVDVLTGGFPCQPFSVAGQRLGTADERHLWPEMLRVIQEIAPRYVVAENVRGLLNWSEGLVFEQVQTDLEAAGYEVAPPFVLPAASVGAPHRRDRIWIVAHANGQRQLQPQRTVGKERRRAEHMGEKDASYADRQRCQKLHPASIPERQGYHRGRLHDCWQEWTPEPPICGMDDGLPHRVDRLRALGNAIVPQIAYRIFLAIQETDTTHPLIHSLAH